MSLGNMWIMCEIKYIIGSEVNFEIQFNNNKYGKKNYSNSTW